MTDQQNQQSALEDTAEYISVTLKIPGKQGEAQPWIVARARNAAAAEDQMRQLQHGGLFAQMGRAQAIMEAAYRQAKSDPSNLKADEPAASVGQEAAYAQANGHAAYNVGNGLGASAATPQPGGADMRGAVNAQAAAQQPQQPQQARPEPAAMQAPPQAPGVPQQQVGMAPQAAAQPAQPQQQGMFGGQQAMPGAPIILGQPARWVTGSNARGPWQAYFDPRPREQTEGLEDTSDPNHPGLAGGTHKFTMWVR